MTDRSQADLVSVIIPTFNQADYLREAIQSVLSQSYRKFEIIVVNNYSTDHTAQVLAAFSDARLVVVNFRNQGVIAASRNAGIRSSRGSIVAFLDSDDYWYPQKLERCMGLISQGFPIVCHAEVWRGEGRVDKHIRYGPASRADYLELLTQGNCLSTSAVLVERQLLENVGLFSEDPLFVTAEDYDLWLSIARSGARFGFLDDELGIYRLHSSSASRAITRHYRAVLAVMEAHARSLNHIFWRDRFALLSRRGWVRFVCAYRLIAARLSVIGGQVFPD